MKAVEVGLSNKLKGDSALTTKLGGSYIYNSVAPPGQAKPYVVFLFTGGGAARFSKSDMRDPTYIVKGVSDSQLEALEIEALIEDALHEQALTVSGYTNVRTQRENEVQINETAGDGTMIYHRGAYYRIIIDD